MKHVDLTSGIGGFALAARWVGWETVGFCEIDEWCRRVLAKNFPGVPQHDDLKTLTAEHVRGWLVGVQPYLDSDEQGEPVGTRHGPPQPAELGPYVLTAGYPCQPFSHAGKRGGADDPRHLWPWIHRLLAGLSDERPDWVVFENVRGHVSMGLDGVLDDLEGLGYATRTFVVPAAGVGALHRRDRVWIVGCRSDVADAANGEREQRRERADSEPAGAASPAEQVGLGCGGADVADATGGEGDGRERGSVAGAEREGRRCDASVESGGQDVADPTGIGAGGSDHKEDAFARGRETRAVSERGSSRGRPCGRVLPDGPEAEPGFCGAADGVPEWVDGPLGAFGRGWEYGVPLTVSGSVPDRVNRLRALGNAIVPQVAYVIFSAIDGAERNA